MLRAVEAERFLTAGAARVGLWLRARHCRYLQASLDRSGQALAAPGAEDEWLSIVAVGSARSYGLEDDGAVDLLQLWLPVMA